MGDVVVWRKVMSQPFREVQSRRGGILLTGSEAMRTGSTYVYSELAMIASALADGSTVTVHQEPCLTIGALRGLLDEHRPLVFHLAAHGTSEELRMQNAPGPTLGRASHQPRSARGRN